MVSAGRPSSFGNWSSVPEVRRLLRRAVLLPLLTMAVLVGVVLWQVQGLVVTSGWVLVMAPMLVGGGLLAVLGRRDLLALSALFTEQDRARREQLSLLTDAGDRPPGPPPGPPIGPPVSRPGEAATTPERPSTPAVEAGASDTRNVGQPDEREEQQLQAQRIEAIGRLAGGIAHDFNNLLAIILGNCHVALQEAAAAGARPELEEIKVAAERAAALTRQLMAFGRRQVLMPEVRPIDTLVTATEKLLRRLLGGPIDLTVRLAPHAGTIKVDPAQFEQVLVNLALNARDAMPAGGQLTIETQAVELDEEYARHHPGVAPGSYVMLAVSDTGAGMDLEVQSHLFEPFFTTKEKGKGSGLGLATVYGIVRQTRGHIWFYSAVDHGTVFKVYFPSAQQQDRRLPAGGSPVAPAVGGRETVLVIEDDPSLRRSTARVLRDLGYTVVETTRGDEALTFLSSGDRRVDLVLADVILPGGSGRVLQQRLLAAAPHLKVVFTSGYTDDAIVRHGVLDAGTSFIQKPFTPENLSAKLRAVLDGTAAPQSPGPSVGATSP